MKTIRINQCTQEDLEWLPGVGPATARKVVEARPVKDMGELQQLIPPSAWLKVQDAGAEFDFGDGAGEELPTIEEVEAALTHTLTPIQLSVTLLQEPRPLTLRRVMPGQELKPGASYMCIWNMRWGPGGEARLPHDEDVEIEVETKLLQHNVSIQFAHYAISVYVDTRSYGKVPLVLFEIIEEIRDDEENATSGID